MDLKTFNMPHLKKNRHNISSASRLYSCLSEWDGSEPTQHSFSSVLSLGNCRDKLRTGKAFKPRSYQTTTVNPAWEEDYSTPILQKIPPPIHIKTSFFWKKKEKSHISLSCLKYFSQRSVTLKEGIGNGSLNCVADICPENSSQIL